MDVVHEICKAVLLSLVAAAVVGWLLRVIQRRWWPTRNASSCGHARAVPTMPVAASRYTLSAQNLDDPQVQLNGQTLALGANDELPNVSRLSVPSGRVDLAPATITFLAMDGAGNAACQ